MRKPILIAVALILWLLNVLASDLIRGTIIWFTFGGAGYFIARFFPWPR